MSCDHTSFALSVRNLQDNNILIIRSFFGCTILSRRIVNTLAARRVDHERGIAERRMRSPPATPYTESRNRLLESTADNGAMDAALVCSGAPPDSPKKRPRHRAPSTVTFTRPLRFTLSVRVHQDP